MFYLSAVTYACYLKQLNDFIIIFT